MSEPETWDLVVVGGGAAGFFAAITYAETHAGVRVLILEKSAGVLGKVKVSGGGRCNVTHACFDPRELASHYPRGSKSLIGPFHRWGAQDTVDWFQARGVPLKTEPDGRMFPTTDDSQTIVDCLTRSAAASGVETRTSCGVATISRGANFKLTTEHGDTIAARSVLLATGGSRLAAGARLAETLGHTLIPAVPSLFAFDCRDPRLEGLAGISVPDAEASVEGIKLTTRGAVLITHRGLSGPGILKLSAWAARELHARNYQFTVRINWLPDTSAADVLRDARQSRGKQQVHSRAPLGQFPKRLWKKLCTAAEVPPDCQWAQLGKKSADSLARELTGASYHISGKSLNKDEFVTCGGVPLKEVNLATMESKTTPGLHFAGELLDVDGVTGGFNFQNAWTTGFLAGRGIRQPEFCLRSPNYP